MPDDTTTTDPKSPNTSQGDDGFRPITTQEDLDRVLGDRLKRERAKFADYDELKAKAARLDELEAANKSELEKANERAAEAEEVARKAAADALRLKVALRHGISDEDAELFLTGHDEETLTRQAERLAAATSDRKKKGPVVPGEGSSPATAASDEREAARQLFGGG